MQQWTILPPVARLSVPLFPMHTPRTGADIETITFAETANAAYCCHALLEAHKAAIPSPAAPSAVLGTPGILGSGLHRLRESVDGRDRSKSDEC